MTTAPPDPSSSSRPPLTDYLREGWKDLELEYQMRKLDVRQGYTETRSRVRRAVRSAKRDARQHARQIRHGAADTYQGLREEVGKDVKDLLDRGRRLTSNLNLSPRRQRAPSDGSTSTQSYESPIPAAPNLSIRLPPLPSLMQRSQLHLLPREKKKRQIMSEIRVYEGLLNSLSFAEFLNALLSSKLTPSADLSQYYRERPELKEFTLETELPRLKYTVYTHTGRKLTQPDEIVTYELEQRELLQETTENEKAAAKQSCDDLHSQYAKKEAIDLLWRAANQSIFGDAITCLTTPAALIRPQLGMASFCNDCSILLDFGNDKPFLNAECYMNVSIPNAEDRRLQLAGVLVGLTFSPLEGIATAKILHLSPSPPLSEADLESAGDSYFGV